MNSKNWASYVAYEFRFSYDTPQQAESWMADIISKCTKCDSDKVSRLQKFIKLSISSMKGLAED
jgi:hypothetical protein